MTGPELVFAVFGVASQALLMGFFAARRFAPQVALPIGWAVYAFAALGLPVGLWLLADGQSWRLVAGPILVAAWAVLGAYVDLWRPREWRGPPIQWSVFAPYVALYFVAQMFMWWPLWNIERTAWVLYLVLFVANTALNLRGHFGEDAGSRV
jgi:hypothetical protein